MTCRQQTQKGRDRKPVVRLKRSGYQPSKAEMEEDISIDATPEAAARAVLTPVRIEYEKEDA